MEWLNYHHLHYFWVIAREGGLTKASKKLKLSHSTLSVQLHSLEDFLGGPLFERRGRSLVLTPFGADVASYADEIFRTGAELVEMARGRVEPRRSVLRVGIVGALPKTVAYRLLQPALAAPGFGPVSVRQSNFEQLLSDLTAGRIHLLLADLPPPKSLNMPVYGHLLGETEVLLYGTTSLAERYRRGFPRSLDGAPMLLPGPGTALRRLLERWLAEHALRVRVEGEFDDAGTMRAFGLGGAGLFPVRAALSAEVDESPAVRRIGTLEGVRERYYAISVERRVREPAMVAMIEQARANLRESAPAHRRDGVVTGAPPPRGPASPDRTTRRAPDRSPPARGPRSAPKTPAKPARSRARRAPPG